MDSSRRAVESYWRSRMIDGATSDEDKVTPVYKLEEICELLRSSHASIVKEVSDLILKRLQHKSPIVKQKALRLIKYAVGKSGAEFRREMQRNSVAIRPLSHYKGQPDPLKGEALNKAVRDTANEAIAVIFSSEESKPPPPAENLNKRIQGFGNTNYDTPIEEKKSFFSEVVGIGSASIKQGISNLTQSNSMKKNETGSYRGPNLHRSLTGESDYFDKYEPVVLQNNNAQSSYGISGNVPTGPWGNDSKVKNTEVGNGDSSSSYSSESKTREERLLETIVTSGGVRLQPTRDALQVRMKAICVLEALLRKKDDEHFVIVASYFEENIGAVLKCSESPQNSLQEKANKVISHFLFFVLSLLGGNEAKQGPTNSGKSVKTEASPVHIPDLIDTGDFSDDFYGEDSKKTPTDQNGDNLTAQGAPFIDDLFSDNTMGTTSEQKNDDDPFADVSFHTGDSKQPVDDLFSGMTIDDNVETSQTTASKSQQEMFDIFGSNSEPLQEQQNHKIEVNDFMAGLSVNNEEGKKSKQNGTSTGPLSENVFSVPNLDANHQISNDSLSGLLGSQATGMNNNANQMFPLVGMPYNFSPGMMLNPAFASQPMNYGAMGNLLTQQQLLATMANLQQLGQLNNSQGASGQASGSNPLPDVFQLNFQNQTPTSTMNGSKKEDTKAFDFISDHLAAARDSKRVA
ncbi:hypothetical protein ACFE04_003882 [Oxalis oulophora]